MSLLVADQLSKTYKSTGWFRSDQSTDQGVHHISFTIESGSCLGLLGESGAGKSTIGKIILGLLAPDSGKVLFQGVDLYAASRSQRRQLRRDLQVVFQDSYSAVNPRMTIKQIIGEPLRNYERLSSKEEIRVISELLEMMGLRADDMHKMPSQMSGGQLQRVNIARAIALKPKLIVLDEPVSSLDMIVQKQILLHLKELKEKHGFSYLFISHDVMAIHTLSDQVAVLDNGTIVETIDAESLFDTVHPSYQRIVGAGEMN